MITSETKDSFLSQKSVNLPGSGLYSIHLTAYDKAGNHKTTRRLVLYDSNSHVSHNPHQNTRVETGSANTNYTWVVDNTTLINIKWTKRFRNALHDHNKWLNDVSPSPGISEVYDDYSGARSVKKIRNVYGEYSSVNQRRGVLSNNDIET